MTPINLHRSFIIITKQNQKVISKLFECTTLLLIYSIIHYFTLAHPNRIQILQYTTESHSTTPIISHRVINMIFISSRLALAIFIANTITLFQSTQALDIRKSREGEECTILVRADLRFDNVDDPSFECILDPIETLVDGTSTSSASSAYSVPIDATEEQKTEMRNKLANGELISNVSTLKMDADFDISDETVRVPRNQNRLEFGTRQGRNNDQNPSATTVTVTGQKPILVVKVKDSEGRVRSETPSEMSNDIFGSFGDSMTLKSQMYDCSFGQLNIVPGVLPNDSDVNVNSPGVIEVRIDVSLSNRRSKVRNAVRRAVENKYGIILPGPYQHVMFVLEGCYEDCGWAAYAYMNSWLSVYQGSYYKFVGVQMHGKFHASTRLDSTPWKKTAHSFIH